MPVTAITTAPAYSVRAPRAPVQSVSTGSVDVLNVSRMTERDRERERNIFKYFHMDYDLIATKQTGVGY